MAISILDPLVDKQGGIRKSASWYRNAISSIADTVDKTDLPPQTNGTVKSPEVAQPKATTKVELNDDEDDTLSYFSRLAEDE